MTGYRLWLKIFRICVPLIAGDGNGSGLSYHNGQNFSTYDFDQDSNSVGNCASRFHGGGWWYGRCYHVNLNAADFKYVDYSSKKGTEYLKVTRMMFRRV